MGAATASAQVTGTDSTALAACLRACNARTLLFHCGEPTPPEPVGGADSLWSRFRSVPYPADAGGAEGRVVVHLVVEPDGSPSEIEVTRGVAPALDSAAVAFVRDLRFRPATAECYGPVRSRYAIPLPFRR